MKGTVTILGALIMGAVLAGALLQWETADRASQVAAQVSVGATATASATNGANSQAAGEVAAGQKVYTTQCNSCHPGGKAGVGPAVRGSSFAAKYPDDSEIKTIIRNGRGGMPGYPVSAMSDDDLAALMAYLRSLK